MNINITYRKTFRSTHRNCLHSQQAIYLYYNFKSTQNKIKLFKGSFGVIAARDPVEIEAMGQNHQTVPKMNKDKKLTPGLPSGFEDRWGKKLVLKKQLLKAIEKNFIKFGAEPLETPSFEYLSLIHI